MTKSDREVIDDLIKALNTKKEKAPIRYKKPKQIRSNQSNNHIDVLFEPTPDIKLVINNKKGLL